MDTSSLKPLTLHTHPGPNPWKIALLLRALSLPYKTQLWTTPALKSPPFITTIHARGYTPVLEDPNNDDANFKLGESGAIIAYLLERYDVDGKWGGGSRNGENANEKYLIKEWLETQNTSQGPLVQSIFRFSEKSPQGTPLPEAKAAFVGVLRQLLKYMDGHLEGEGKEWLVGGRCTAADLVFVPFQERMGPIMGDAAPQAGEFPNVERWVGRLKEMEEVKAVLAEWGEATKKAFAPLAGK